MRGSGSSEGWSAVDSSSETIAERLQAARPLHGLDHDARALVRGLEPVPAQAGDVEEHVRHAVVRHDEAEALGHVEPLDAAADLDELERTLSRRSPAPPRGAELPADSVCPFDSVRAGTVIVGHEQTRTRIAPADS